MTVDLSIQQDIELLGKIEIIPSILDVITRTTGMGFTCIARVTEDRWIACTVKDDIGFGLPPGGELKLETTICNEIRQNRDPVIIDNVAEDEKYCDHHTPRMYGLQSYISFPIFLRDGSFFGTLCAIDPKPAELNNPKIIGLFKCFVDLIALHIDQSRELVNTHFNYIQEKETAQLREGFIAVLGHDLRTPVTAISAASQLLNAEEKNKPVVSLIRRSVKRIDSLIANMLDLARGRLAGGIDTIIVSNTSLGAYLQQVIDELQIIHADKKIHLNMNLDRPIKADNNRIAQLLSNILSNALRYGSPNEPVDVNIYIQDDQLLISVTNKGKKIPDDIRTNLFRPFSRGDKSSGPDGLGLGLYIAQEIARAHRGKLKLESTDEKTNAIFVMPVEG